MVIGATVFGYIVGSVSALASNPNGSQARETVKILAVSNYLGEKKVQQKLRQARPGTFLHNLIARNFASKCVAYRLLHGRYRTFLVQHTRWREHDLDVIHFMVNEKKPISTRHVWMEPLLNWVLLHCYCCLHIKNRIGLRSVPSRNV